MAKKKLNNEDKMLRAILSEPRLIKTAEYNLEDYQTVDDVLLEKEPNCYAKTVAQMIRGLNNGDSESQIYKTLLNELSVNL